MKGMVVMKNKLNIKKFFKHHTLLASTLTSYAAIILISVIVLTSVIMTFFVSEIQKQLIRVQNQSLHTFSSKADDLVSKISNISYAIYFNPKISIVNNFKNPLGRASIIKEISNLTLNSTGIYDLIFYTDASEYLHTRESTYTYETLESVYDFGKQDKSFLEDLKTADTLKIYPALEVNKSGEIRRVVPIIFPDTHKSFAQKKSILFFIEESKLLTPPEDFDYSLFLTNENGDILAGSGSKISQKNININKQKGKIEGTNYYVFKNQASLADMQYVMLVPVKTIDGILSKLKIIVIISIIIILIISFVIIALAIKYNYKPVMALKDLIEKTTGKTYDSPNELDAIEDSVTDMVNSIQSFVDFNTSNKSTFRDVLLSNIMQGFYDDLQEVNSLVKYSNIFFRFKDFCIISLYFQDAKKLDIYEKLTSIENHFESFDIFFKSSENSKIFHALLCFDEKTDIDDIASKINEAIKELEIKNPTFGISSVSKQLSQMWCLYMEAATALDYRLVKGLGSMIYFSEINLDSSNIGEYPSAQIEAFGMYLEQGQVEKALEMIDIIFQYTQNNASSLFMARCLCFDIITTILKKVKAISHKPPNTQPFNIMHFETIEELIKEAKVFCINECKSIDNDNYVFNEAIKYIKENYCDIDLSIKKIADHLSISQSGLYNLFKDNLSITPLQYINSLQIEHVKDLLTSTDIPINTIVQNIGRADASNFIRKFKNQVGMTPGEYRRYYGIMKTE